MTEQTREDAARNRGFRQSQPETGNIFGFLIVWRVEAMTAASSWLQDFYRCSRHYRRSLRGDSNIFRLFRFALAGGFDHLNYVTLVKPGIAIAGVANGPHSYFGGVRSSVEFMACSQVTACPV